jgi:hypothetical protein
MKLVTRVLDALFTQLNLNAQKNTTWLQMFLCILNLVFSVYPLIMYFVYSNNIHVLFWMGMAPTYANLSVPFSLCLLNLGVTVISTLRLQTKVSQKLCFILFLVLGSVNIGSGAWVLIEAARVEQDLIHECGSTTLTARIEAEWQRLSTFHAACQATTGKTLYIQECPNFAATFPNRVYVNYIEDVELDYACVGFCQFWAAPLFNLDADRGLRCATALGEDMNSVGNKIGIPTMITGLAIGTWGVCLLLYDHL